MWCQKRITNQDLLVRFGDGKHRFYLESVCGVRVIDGDLCDHCKSLTCQTRTQDVRTFPHGTVNTAYTKESHIYDSPWYHTKVKAYGVPYSEVVELGMEAQKRARAGRKTAKVADLITAPEQIKESQVPTKPPLNEPKKRVVRKTKKEASTTPQLSVLDQLGNQVITRIPSETILAESTDTPIEIDDVVRITFKGFTHGSVRYWRDTSSDKLYIRLADGGKGAYIGHWNGEGIVEGDLESD